jgi:hypothetical protein
LAVCGRSPDQSQFRADTRDRLRCVGEAPILGRVQSRRSARHEERGVFSGRGCGVAKPGADGPARRSSLVAPDVTGKTTANPLAADRRGPRQDDQAGKTKLPARSCSRSLDQGLGSTRARCSRDRPLERPSTKAGLAQGWAGLPGHSRLTERTSQGTPAPDVDAPCLVTRWSNRSLCLSCDSCFLE